MNDDQLQEALSRLVKPFLDQGTPTYIARCCGRLYAGTVPPKLCRGCRGSPRSVQIKSLSEASVENLPDGGAVIP